MDKRSSFVEELISNQTPWFETVVLACVFRHKESRSRALKVINVNPSGKSTIQDFTAPLDHALFEALRIYVDCVGRSFGVPEENFMEAILTQMADSGQTIARSEIPQALDRFRELFTIDVESAVPIMMQGIKFWLSKQRTARVIGEHTAVSTWDPASMWQETQQNITALKSLTSEGSFFSFGHGVDNHVLDISRVKLHTLPGLTDMLGGGVAKEEAILFVAPQGAGKTILACQLGLDLSTHSRQTGIICTTEQGHEQLEPRIISNGCDIPYNLIMDKFRDESLLPHQLAAYKNLRQSLSGKLFWEDWNKEDRSRSIAGDLYDVVHARQDQLGRKIDYLILDWIGGALGRVALKDADKIRHIYQATGDTLCQLAVDEKMITVGFAQATMANSVNTVKVDASKIGECKSLGQNFTSVVGVTLMLDNDAGADPDSAPIYSNRQYFYASKTRKGTGGLRSFARKYDYQRIHDPSRK